MSVLRHSVKWWVCGCLCFQLYIQYDPSQVLNVNQNYLSSSQMVQRPGPVQSNVVPTITPSSSFYSGSAGKTEFCLADLCRVSYIPSLECRFYPNVRLFFPHSPPLFLVCRRCGGPHLLIMCTVKHFVCEYFLKV